MTIQCDVCSGTEFHLQEGLRYCTTCLTQSQQHGMETVVDEITMGSQPHEKKSTKMFSKKKRRKKEDCYRSFTSLDGFSVILRGWSEEAMLLGLTGPSFQPLLHQLFATYLKKTGRAYLYKNSKPHLGIKPNFRDVQVALTGRSKLCCAQTLRWSLHKRTTYIKKKGDLKMEDLDDTSSVSKRKRRKKRKAFFDSFLSGSSCKSDVNDDISFGESGTNSVITDSLETGSEFSSLASSVDDELLEDQNRIFERIWKSFSKKKKYPISVSERAYHLALPVLFALFSLALILQDDSRVCIADLLFFIECDSISFYDAFVHIPKFMRLQGNEDILRFSRHRAYRKLEPEGIKVIMYQMISLLELGNVNFGGPFMDLGSDHPNSIIERYIQEFSLPKVLSQTIRNAFKHTNLIDNLYCHKSELKNSMIPDVSIRACAIILVVLKYIYGLDDFTEHYISSTIRKMNEGKSSSECKFVIDDWVRLSRSRILLIMRHSATFFNKFKELLPRTRMCHSTYITDIRNMEESFLKKEAIYVKNSCKRKKLDRLGDFILRIYGENLPSRSMSYINETLTPMHKFSTDVLGGKDSDSCDIEPISEDKKDDLRQLLEMHEKNLGMENPLIKDEYVIPIELPIVETSRLRVIKYVKNTQDSSEFIKLINANEKYSLEKRYYKLVMSDRKVLESNSRFIKPVGSDEKMLIELPDSYSWILQYFSNYIYSTPALLNSDVEYVEKEILRADKNYFGKKMYSSTEFFKKGSKDLMPKILKVIDDVIANKLNDNA